MSDPRPDSRLPAHSGTATGSEGTARPPGGGWGGSRGGVVVAAFLPGLPQLLAGRSLGAIALVLWLGGLAVGVGRWERVLHAAMGDAGQRGALAILVSMLAAVWLWSLVDAHRSPTKGTSLLRGGHDSGFRPSRVALAGAAAVGLVAAAAALAPLLAPYDPTAHGDLVGQRFLPPSGEHLLGTDGFGRDLFSRILYGARLSLAIAALAVFVSVSVGTLVGATAGFFGGAVDGVLMRLVDTVMAFPRLVLLIAVMALFEPSIAMMVLVLGLTQWPQTARIVRGEVLSLREREFVLAARGSGLSRRRVLFRHVLPNAGGPIIVAATLGIGDVIVLEAGLSFLGLGVQPPTPSWGGMVADGRDHLLNAWWVATFPGLAIVLAVLAFNLVGDGLRDALDPRTR